MSLYDNFNIDEIREILKYYFMTGKKPTQVQFHELIDTIMDKNVFNGSIDLACNNLLNVSSISSSCGDFPIYVYNDLNTKNINAIDLVIRNLTAQNIDILNYEISGFEVTGDLNLQQNLTVSGNQLVLGNVGIQQNLTVSGNTLLLGDLNLSGCLVTDCADIKSLTADYIRVDRVDILNYEISGFEVTGDLNLQQNLTVSGNTTLIDNVTINNNLTVDSNINVSGVIYTPCGNSEEWCSTFNTVQNNSAFWDGNFCDETVYLSEVSVCSSSNYIGIKGSVLLNDEYPSDIWLSNNKIILGNENVGGEGEFITNPVHLDPSRDFGVGLYANNGAQQLELFNNKLQTNVTFFAPAISSSSISADNLYVGNSSIHFYNGLSEIKSVNSGLVLEQKEGTNTSRFDLKNSSATLYVQNNPIHTDPNDPTQILKLDEHGNLIYIGGEEPSSLENQYLKFNWDTNPNNPNDLNFAIKPNGHGILQAKSGNTGDLTWNISKHLTVSNSISSPSISADDIYVGNNSIHFYSGANIKSSPLYPHVIIDANQSLFELNNGDMSFKGGEEAPTEPSAQQLIFKWDCDNNETQPRIYMASVNQEGELKQYQDIWHFNENVKVNNNVSAENVYSKALINEEISIEQYHTLSDTNSRQLFKLTNNGDLQYRGGEDGFTQELKFNWDAQSSDFDFVINNQNFGSLKSFGENWHINSNLNVSNSISTQSITANSIVVGSYSDSGFSVSNFGVGVSTINISPSANYNAAFYNIAVVNGTNVKASNFNISWSSAGISFSEATTTDVGSTSSIKLSAGMINGQVVLQSIITSGTWTIKGSKKLI
jgi:cytoskeletal protein CcmA (bactofilin family)